MFSKLSVTVVLHSAYDKLSLNITKTHSIVFSNNPKWTERENKVDGIIIESVNCWC